MPKIVFSSERRADPRLQLGTAHYSYGFAEARFAAALAAAGYAPAVVDSPEIFKDDRTYRSLLGVSAREVIHIAFRSTENLRPMAGAINIAAYVWEFPVMRDRHLATDDILHDQVHMLRLVDEIWVSCRFTADVYARYGLTNVRVIPPPITGRRPPVRMDPAEAVGRLRAVPSMPLSVGTSFSRDANAALVASGAASLADHPAVKRRLEGGEGRIFLTVCNPGDLRKNLLNVVEGFQMASGGGDRDLLVIKFVLPNRGNFRATAAFDALLPLLDGPGALADPRIRLVCDYLDEAEMTALMSLADFYVSGSHAEGLNLPLVEAMAFGIVPVATRNTAMLDYLDDRNAIVIDERSFASPVPDMAARIAGTVFETAFASRFDIGRAIKRAQRAPSPVLAALGDQAKATVDRLFGEAAVMGAVRDSFAAFAQRTKVAA